MKLITVQNSYESLTMTKRRMKNKKKKRRRSPHMQHLRIPFVIWSINSLKGNIHLSEVNTTCAGLFLSSNFFFSFRCFFVCRFVLISIEFPHSNGNHWSNAHFVEIHFAFEPLYITNFTPSSHVFSLWIRMHWDSFFHIYFHCLYLIIWGFEIWIFFVGYSACFSFNLSEQHSIFRCFFYLGFTIS